MACKKIGDRLMAFVDDEMDAEERARMEEHLETCPSCAEDVRAYEKMREMARQLRLREPPPEFWDEYPRGVVARTERGIGWLLVIAGTVLLAGFVMYELWTDSDAPLVFRISITGLLAGLGLLLWSVGRRRWKEAKTDKYKEIIR